MTSNSRAILYSAVFHLVLFGIAVGISSLGKEDGALKGMVSVSMSGGATAVAPSYSKEVGEKRAKKGAGSSLPQNPGTESGSSTLTLNAEYPRASRLMGEEGEVLVEAKILDGGSVDSARIISSSGFARLDQAAKEAVEKAHLEGAAAHLRMFSVVFRLR